MRINREGVGRAEHSGAAPETVAAIIEQVRTHGDRALVELTGRFDGATLDPADLRVDPAALEGPVWLRRAVAPLLGVPMDHRETYFLLRDVVHEVDVRGQTEIEAYEDQPHRWWSAEEIRRSAEVFVPTELASALDQLLVGPWTGPPRVVS